MCLWPVISETLSFEKPSPSVKKEEVGNGKCTSSLLFIYVICCYCDQIGWFIRQAMVQGRFVSHDQSFVILS